MLNAWQLVSLMLAKTAITAFPLSFQVEKDNPLCFIERFDFNEVALKESYAELQSALDCTIRAKRRDHVLLHPVPEPLRQLPDYRSLLHQGQRAQVPLHSQIA